MKISIFLIITSFTHFVCCCSQNITDDSNAECAVKFFRRKRTPVDYTRWVANLEPTQEFIVKVLDEDLPKPSQRPKKVIAVNIQPVTKSVEKIIIGGAMITLPTSKHTTTTLETDLLKDYTRFVPPTTVATRVEGDIFRPQLRPGQPSVRSEKYVPALGPKLLNPQRDESPPASPQFIPRSPAGPPRQYAPIAPVAFSPRVQFSPLTPPLNAASEPYMMRKAFANVILSTPLEDVLEHATTKSDVEDYGNLHAFDDDQADVTRTTLVTQAKPERTVKTWQDSTSATTEAEFSPTSDKNDDYTEKKSDEKDDAEDGIFYSYEDISMKKTEKVSTESYDDKQNQRVQINEIKIPETTQGENFVLRVQADTTNQEYYEIPEEPRRYKSTLDSSTTVYQDTTTIERKTPMKSLKDTLRDKRRNICSLVKLRELNFNSPRTLPEIEAKLKQWAEDSPVAKWVDITDGNLTTMERPIYMMIVDDPSSGQVITAKQTVVIVAGIQGRDHHAVAAAMYVLYQLIERTDQHSDLLSKFRFWIIPVLNPDGYDYAMTFPHRREWTKNLRQNWDVCKGRGACQSCDSFGLRCTIQPCYGVNLDRNFEYQWIPAEELRMEHPCGTLYAGKRQLSEIETSSFVNYLHSQHRPIFLFIAFKEGEVLGVMYPHSHTRKKRAYDHIFKQRASRAATAAYSISGRPYLAGQTSQFLPLYAGGIEDWVDGHLGVDNTFTIMMFRPADSFNSKILTERVVHEAYAAMDTLVLQSLEEPAAEVPDITLVRPRSSAHFLDTSIALLLLVTVLLICNT